VTIRKKSKPTPEEEEQEHLKDVYLDAVVEKYIITNHPNDLADYIQKGGELTSYLREAVVKLLRTAPKGNKSDPYGALEAFSNINALLKMKDGPKTKTAAYELYAEGKSFSARGAKEKYSQGKKLTKVMFG